MRSVLTSLWRLIFGETWTIPLGVGVALALAVLMRAALPQTAWQTAGGFCLAVFVLAALAYSLLKADGIEYRGRRGDYSAAHRPRQRAPRARS